MPHSHSVQEALAELPKCPVPFPPPAPELGRLRCMAAEEPLPPVPVTQRAGEGHGEAQGCLLVFRSLEEELHPRSVGEGGAAAKNFVL